MFCHHSKLAVEEVTTGSLKIVSPGLLVTASDACHIDVFFGIYSMLEKAQVDMLFMCHTLHLDSCLCFEPVSGIEVWSLSI